MSPWAALRAVVIFVYVFMLGPILITAAVSFNESNRSQFPPRGFSLQWWGRALSAEWVDPLWFSLARHDHRAHQHAARAAARLRAARVIDSPDATPWWRSRSAR